MTMTVEVWSDVVCPWCFIGKRRLETALAESGVTDVEVVHRAFQLDPTARTEGRRTVEVLAQKYGMDAAGAATMMGQVSDIARGEGLDYRLTETVSGNTELAHRVLLWAQEMGRGQELLECLYTAYFEQAQPVFTIDDLLPHVQAVGLDPQAARDAAAAPQYADRVREDLELARSFGASGVPFFVVDRRYGISGAQPREVFVQTLAAAAAPEDAG